MRLSGFRLSQLCLRLVPRPASRLRDGDARWGRAKRSAEHAVWGRPVERCRPIQPRPPGSPRALPAPAAGQPEPGAAAAEPNAKPEADTAAAPAKPARAGSQILVNVDKSLQEMTVFVDGIEKYQWPVSTGLRGYSTPSGNYTASSMNKIWYSKQWDNAPMPHAIFFTKDGHAIHGSLETKKLGRAASHGCVRVSPKNAETLFHLVEQNGLENTKVVLSGVTPGGEGEGGGSTRSSLSRRRCCSLGTTIHRHAVSSVGSGAPAGVEPTLLLLAIASSAGAGSKGPAGITRLTQAKDGIHLDPRFARLDPACGAWHKPGYTHVSGEPQLDSLLLPSRVVTFLP